MCVCVRECITQYIYIYICKQFNKCFHFYRTDKNSPQVQHIHYLAHKKIKIKEKEVIHKKKKKEQK